MKRKIGKVKPGDIPDKERYIIIGEFFDLIVSLKHKGEVIDFFIGLLTQSESLMLARRIQTAKLLMQEKSYDEIKEKLKVGNSTIANTDKWLDSRGGRYRKILERHFHKEKNNQAKNPKCKKNYKSQLDKSPEYKIFKKVLGL